jgi:phosphoenolpyruvate-protein phosphotransferase
MSQLINTDLVAPLSGVFLPLSDVPDPVFAQKMVGDGFAIDPRSNELTSPCSGSVVLLHKSNHAITIETSSGQQVLMHIGIDTVNLGGKGFNPLVKVGDKVRVGTPLISFDLDYLAIHSKSLITPVLILDSEEMEIQGLCSIGSSVKAGEPIFRFSGTSEVNDLIDENSVWHKGTAFILPNPAGMHARPCAKLIAISKSFQSEIKIIKNEKSANAKSLVGVLALEIVLADNISVEARGVDAGMAIHEIEAFLSSYKEEIQKEVESKTSLKKEFIQKEGFFYGVCASGGKALGRVYQLNSNVFDIPTHDGSSYRDKQLLSNAIGISITELSHLAAKTKGANSSIFEAHQEILNDPELMDRAGQKIDSGVNCAKAWFESYSETITILKALKNSNLAARSMDIQDVGERVLKKLLDGDFESSDLANLPKQTILIADNLSPSDTAKLNKENVLGFATVAGGANSHVAILAKSLGIPAIAGVDKSALNIKNGQEIILNADQGFCQLDFSDEDKAFLIAEKVTLEAEYKKELSSAHEPALTTDGIHIEVAANITSEQDAREAQVLGCDGVGLLRSEFIYFDRTQAPDLNEQIEIYQGISNALNKGSEKPLVIRTLDVGGDKPLSYLPIEEEENPFLGSRGIRVSLDNIELFTIQIRAILSVTPCENINIMFPMVSNLEELLEAKEIVLTQQKELGVKNVSIGIMVEVPSVALMADVFASHVDFFSIGANDLTQYTLAIDRGHSKLAPMADSLNPAVLRLIHMTCQAAKKQGIWVGVCGGIASDIIAVPILIGLGVTELSVSIPMIPKVKSKVRQLDLNKCIELANKAICAKNANEVRSLKIN